MTLGAGSVSQLGPQILAELEGKSIAISSLLAAFAGSCEPSQPIVKRFT